MSVSDRLQRSLRAAALLGVLGGASGCESAETKICLRGYESAQALVMKVDPKSEASVAESSKAVESALAACRAANRHEEVDQLIRARNLFTAQASALERRARRKRSQRPTPDDLLRLEKDGDDSCPRGQAYRVQGATKDIRCTGPQLAEMTLARVKDYFEELGYRITASSPTALSVEHGAERYELFYALPDAAPSCVVMVPPPGLPWQEALARATGVNPGRLKNPGTVKMAHGSLDYTVDESKVIIRLGRCAPPG